LKNKALLQRIGNLFQLKCSEKSEKFDFSEHISIFAVENHFDDEA